MYQIVHGAAGLMIGSRVGNPLLAFVLGIVSHFILDAIPHDSKEARDWENNGTDKFVKKVALEAIIDLWGLVILVLVVQEGWGHYPSYPMIAGMVGGIFPDYVWGLGELFQTRNKLLKKFKIWHEWVHTIFYRPIYLPLKYTITVQTIILIILIALIKF